jgi:hypothetical protein
MRKLSVNEAKERMRAKLRALDALQEGVDEDVSNDAMARAVRRVGDRVGMYEGKEVAPLPRPQKAVEDFLLEATIAWLLAEMEYMWLLRHGGYVPSLEEMADTDQSSHDDYTWYRLDQRAHGIDPDDVGPDVTE